MAFRSGIVKNIDSMGRMVVPKEVREFLGVTPDDGVELICEGNVVVLRKFELGCMFCGKINNSLKDYSNGKKVCSGCIKEFLEKFSE
jgi:transcriptional pleiotropic regulator of transition state genes